MSVHLFLGYQMTLFYVRFYRVKSCGEPEILDFQSYCKVDVYLDGFSN